MKALGIDPGIRTLGWGFIDTERGERKWGEISTSSGKELPDRLLELESRFISILSDLDPDFAAMESVVFHKNPNSALLLGAARAVVLLALAHKGIPVLELSPTAVKRAIVGRGNARKAQVAYMVNHLLGLDGMVSSHAADALACAMVGIWREEGRIRFG